MGRGHLCMSEPGLDGQEVHAGLEKLHGEGVPEDVWRYGLVGQGWPDDHGLGGRPPNDVRCSETSQAFIVGPDENRPRLVMGDSAFFQQGRHHSHQILGNGDDAVSAPLAAEQHLRVRSPQLKVVCVDASGLGDPGAGPRQEKQKRPVAPTTGRPLIGCRNEGVHFGHGEVVRHLNMSP